MSLMSITHTPKVSETQLIDDHNSHPQNECKTAPT